MKGQEALRLHRAILAAAMRRAASLLVNSGANVKQVSRDCGFDDPNYFAKAFRKSYGASPTEYRTTGMYSNVARAGAASERESV
jgi:AraC-like DNA-binding protein